MSSQCVKKLLLCRGTFTSNLQNVGIFCTFIAFVVPKSDIIRFEYIYIYIGQIIHLNLKVCFTIARRVRCVEKCRLNITLSNFLVSNVTREDGQGPNTKMIPRSFETAASFITRRLIQYHASLVRISTDLFIGRETFNI